ncbi:unnamed protein product [Closterium sp. Naga37s-1]|nr:unnamed protein product [Closterium sp. Naga37s-1]
MVQLRRGKLRAGGGAEGAARCVGDAEAGAFFHLRELFSFPSPPFPHPFSSHRSTLHITRWGQTYLTREFFHLLVERLGEKVLVVVAEDEAGRMTYLTREFFHLLGERLGEKVLLVVAEDGTGRMVGGALNLNMSWSGDETGRMVGGALNLVGGEAVFGRNWGALPGTHYPFLHFEASIVLYDAMVRPASEYWEHVKKIKDADERVVGATCIHCTLPVTANATRIREHIFGTNKKDKNVAMCKSDYAKQRRATADQERSSTGNGSGGTGGSNRASTSTVETTPARRSRQRDIREMTDEVAQTRLDYLWAAAVAENDLAFNVSKSKSIQAFVDAVIVYAKPYTLPTPYKVSGPLLDKLKADSEDLVRPLKDSWKTSGCTLSINGWTCIKSRGLVCVIALNDTAPVIVDIVDSKTARKTRDYLAGLIDGAIKTVGPKHVVQVVMDNASNNKNAANKLRVEYPHIFFTNCAAHCLDLMLHDIGNIPAVKRVLAQVHSVVMMIKGSASAVVLFRELFTKLSLVRPGATRFGTQVIMLGRFLEVKRALRAMVVSEEWDDVAVARTEEGMEVRKLLLDDVFWDCGTAVLRLMTPVYEVLRAVDTRAQLMGQLYGLMLEATVKTTKAAEEAGNSRYTLCAAAHFIKRTGLLLHKDKSTFLTAIKSIIARRWDAQLHNPLHALGWLLNPRNQYIAEVRNDPEIRKGTDEVIQARGGDVQQRVTLAAQVAQFHRGEGRLGSHDARWAATTLVAAGRMTDAEWWFLFGGDVQALQDLAVTSLSQPVTSSEVERYWSALARVQRRDRNRLTAQKMTDVTFVAFTRRARDAFDRKAALRSKLYSDLGNGTLREGAAIIPAEVEEEEGDAEEEGQVEVEECTIDWSEFGSIGKKRKGKAGNRGGNRSRVGTDNRGGNRSRVSMGGGGSTGRAQATTKLSAHYAFPLARNRGGNRSRVSTGGRGSAGRAQAAAGLSAHRHLQCSHHTFRTCPPFNPSPHPCVPPVHRFPPSHLPNPLSPLQAIEAAIEAGLARVEAGAQGEHKLPQGYLPTATYSTMRSRCLFILSPFPLSPLFPFPPCFHFPLPHFSPALQAIEAAIEAGLARVEAGAQGEHKLPRGYLPTATYSAHHIPDPAFRSAIAGFLERETVQVQYALSVMDQEANPFKKPPTTGAS